jgi:hypothetical protein
VQVSLRCYDEDRPLMERAQQQGSICLLGSQSCICVAVGCFSGIGSTSADVLKYFTDRFHQLLASHPVFSKRTIFLWEDLYENHKNGEMGAPLMLQFACCSFSLLDTRQ